MGSDHVFRLEWSVVLNEQEHKAASEAAASAGVSKSLWLRQVLRKAAGLDE